VYLVFVWFVFSFVGWFFGFWQRVKLIVCEGLLWDL